MINCKNTDSQTKSDCKRLRVTLSGYVTTSNYKWLQVTTGDYKWLRVTESQKSSDYGTS